MVASTSPASVSPAVVCSPPKEVLVPDCSTTSVFMSTSVPAVAPATRKVERWHLP